ncbi:hypothetical protein CF326_g8908 [Tilletia indica]|nr:hypothetical protein CF326_g8908 [Tilletia indica]
MVENFISTSPHLTDIVIEDDSHPELDGLRRPILDLSSLVKAGAETSYFGLERFIIRAPAVQVNAVDCGSFLNRFQEATTICFAVYQIITRKPSWAWALDVLDVANYVERVEVSTSMSTEGDYRRQTPSTTPINLVNLRHLQLDLHEVDARLLFRLNAPKLRHLQIRSYREVSAHGELPHNHFPEMFSATVWCPGGAADRFRALGLRKRQYIHNISRTVLFEPQVDRELMIFIQKLAPDPPGGPSRSEPPHKRARVADSTSQDQLRQHSV